MKQMLAERDVLYAAKIFFNKTPKDDKLVLFYRHCQRKWIEDSIDPYSLNSVIETQESFNKIFPVYNIDKLTKKTKETEQNSALMTSYVKIRMLNSISSRLIKATS